MVIQAKESAGDHLGVVVAHKSVVKRHGRDACRETHALEYGTVAFVPRDQGFPAEPAAKDRPAFPVAPPVALFQAANSTKRRSRQQCRRGRIFDTQQVHHFAGPLRETNIRDEPSDPQTSQSVDFGQGVGRDHVVGDTRGRPARLARIQMGGIQVHFVHNQRRVGLRAKLGNLARKLKRATRAAGVQTVGSPDHLIDRAVIVAGAAGSMPFRIPLAPSDVIITGEIRHHDALTIRRIGCTAVALGHWSSERPVLTSLSERLQAAIPRIVVKVSTVDEDPLRTV